MPPSWEGPVIHLADKIVIVTAGTWGIGAAIAQTCAELGGKIVLTGRSDAAGAELANGIQAKGGVARFVQGDVTAPGFADRLLDDVQAHEGRIDVLVNNA